MTLTMGSSDTCKRSGSSATLFSAHNASPQCSHCSGKCGKTSSTFSTETIGRRCPGCLGWPPGFFPDFSFFLFVFFHQGSDDGGLEVLEEFWFRRTSRSLIRCSSFSLLAASS